MSKYTTGEIAKLCGVSVRTVQYYDSRNILIPSELSEGGRRLYSENDLKRMRIICFLREAGLPINSISELFNEEYPEKIISVLLDQQEQILREEIAEGQKKLSIIETIKRELKEIENFSVESIGDIAHIMKQNNNLAKMRWITVLTGIPVTALQWTSIVLWITHGLWWLFAIWVCVAIPWGIIVSIYYYKHVAYICPECHEIFRPRFKEMFWAYHTPKMRRLTCPKCGRKGLCVEVYAQKDGASNG
ncbi:MerR family transcriptional regulator [Parabacteroides johnsonii]|uniref:MerR family transcriptional regulator n=1 Tax=Parabacteroides johnsonii TaxID=387661 RepID=UPI00242C0BEA|nr:MerR family transcriptional regulator [Parabacteroides johnsonii]